MNAQTPLTPDLDAIAAPYAGYDEQPYYTAEEWREAAQYYADTGDDAELLSMQRDQRAFDAWFRLSEAEQDRWAGFGNYRWWATQRPFQPERERVHG